MCQVRNLIGAQGAAAACVLGPTEYSGLKEGAIDDQLPTALEKVEQGYLTMGAVEFVLLLHRHPRHSSPVGGQRITRTRESLLFHEELLPRRVPLLPRNDRRCLHCDMLFFVLPVFLFAYCHVISPLFSETERNTRSDKNVLNSPMRTARI